MKRFYREVTVAPADGGWRVLLDGRGIKTPQRREEVLPNEPVANLLAEEWKAQGDKIDPATFPLRDLADYALDQVAPDPGATVDTLLRYAETDTLCYRADPDEHLHTRQLAEWEPLLRSVEEAHGLRFERVSGVLHRPQPADTMASLRSLLMGHNPYTLAALVTLTSLAASLSIALAALQDDAEPDVLWNAANLEEDWQAEQWGWDPAAQERRNRRLGEFSRAMHFARQTLLT